MPEPIYRQLADDLRKRIEAGEFAFGGPLPTELELRERYDVSRNTVRDAMKLLIAGGLVVTRPGQGTFVAVPIDPVITVLGPGMPDEASGFAIEVTGGSREPMATAPRVEIQLATGVVARELQLAEGETVVSRHQQRYIDDAPWSLQTHFYPMSLVDRGATDLLQAKQLLPAPAAYLAQKLGISQVAWAGTLSARGPDDAEVIFFNLPEHTHVPVVEISQTAYDAENTPIWLSITSYPADRNLFRQTWGRVPLEVSPRAL